MSSGQLYPIIVQGAFSCFLLTFLYAIFRWIVKDTRSRGRRAWLLATLMIAAPVLAVVSRLAFRSVVPRGLMAGVGLGVPLLIWLVWLVIRPAVEQGPSGEALNGPDSSASRWILVLSVLAAGYGAAVVWLAQIVMYPLYLSVPPAGFLEYYSKYEVAIVFPVIVALSASWTLVSLLTFIRPRAVPAWAPWTAAGLALVGFIASQALESPYNQKLLDHGFDADAINAKIAFNWFRLIAWTLQAALLGWMTVVALRANDFKRAQVTGCTGST